VFCVVDREKGFAPVKSGFKTSSQADNWAKKNLPRDDVHLWGEKWDLKTIHRYFVRMK
jgi:hypothetical protein